MTRQSLKLTWELQEILALISAEVPSKTWEAEERYRLFLERLDPERCLELKP